MRQLICGVAIGIGSGLFLAAALILAKGHRRGEAASPNIRKSESSGPSVGSPFRRDYFRIRHTGNCWLLRGHGRFKCNLEFATWQEAMNQARFRLETLGRYESDLRNSRLSRVTEQSAFPELLS